MQPLNGELWDSLNAVYEPLNHRLDGLVKRMRAASERAISAGYYSGHYSRRENGRFEREAFPIPVLTVDGLCDMELHLEHTSITTKIAKADRARLTPAFLKEHRPEVYGVQDYLQDYEYQGLPWPEFQQRLRLSQEEAFFLTFAFPQDAGEEDMVDLVHVLSKLGCFY